MATALAAVRLQRPQQDVVDAVHRYMEVVHGMRQLGSSGASRVRALGGLGRHHPSKGVTSHSRGRICRVPLFSTSSPRRVALISAMSEEHDITDMQETDKVSGEWWKPILTAVHDWSQDKLLGLAELADGSLFFSFGPGSDSTRPAKPSKVAKISSSATHNPPPPKMLPQRHPSSFRKHSPIPASRKKATDLQKAAKEATKTQPPGGDKPQKPQKAKSSSKSAAQPQRPPSSFSKRSPIPKDRVSVPASTSKKKSHSGTPAVETPSKAQPAAAVDSPFSPELKEILNHGKETAGQDSKESAKSTTTSSGAPARKKASKVLSEETVEGELQPESGGSSAKKKTSKTESEETVEVVGENENGAVSKDLGSYKLPELRSLAKARGLKGYSKLKKGELVDLLAGLES